MDTPEQPDSLLIVVDDEAKSSRILRALEPDGYVFQTVINLEAPLPSLGTFQPDLAIIWFPYSSPEAMPELESIIREVQQLGRPLPLPVLLIIDQYGSHWVEPGFRLGVTDILTRPIHPLVLRQRVRLLLRARQTEQAVARHKMVAEALKAERQHLFTVLDMLPVYVFLQKLDFSISFANRTFIRLFGEPGNRKCYEIFKGQKFPCENCYALQAVRNKTQQQWEWNRGDGRTFMVYDSTFADSNGTDVVLEIGVDITELKRTEIALRQEEERFRTVADFTYDWEYWSDQSGKLIYNSPACKRITGYPAEAFINDPALLLQIVHPEDQKILEDHFNLEVQSDKIYALDFRILTADGQERWIGHACQPVFSSDSRPSGRRVSNRDITQRKQTEQALLRAERLAAMGRLLASLAHEINNPLQAMCSNMELVTNFSLDEVERQKYLQVVQQEIERLMSISQNILDFSRPRKTEIQPASIVPILDRSIVLASKRLKDAHIRITRNLTENLPQVLVSPDQLSQVFLNLMINATEHMPVGGQLEISTQLNDNQLEIHFADNGPGIPAEVLELIFEPFYTTKKDGTGLGLAISQNIIQHFGGTLTAQSVLQKGSIFIVTLPVNS
jgi:PAS domain S-box-containing protein